MTGVNLCRAIQIFKKYGFSKVDAILMATRYHYGYAGRETGEYTVEKRGNKWCVVHGHPKKPGSKTDKPKGSVIACHDTEKEAEAQHAAIKARQAQQSTGNKKTRKVEMNADDKRPPKEWWDACVEKVSSDQPDLPIENVENICGDIWHNRGVREKL